VVGAVEVCHRKGPKPTEKTPLESTAKPFHAVLDDTQVVSAWRLSLIERPNHW
jgi:hypothetical protein